MMKKFIITSCLFVGLFVALNAQQLVLLSPGGALITDGSLQGSFSLGEMVISTESSQGIKLTQGFQQAMLFVVGIKPVENGRLHVYPNPVSHYIYVELPLEEIFVHVQIMSLDGKIHLNQNESVTGLLTLDVRHLPTGSYILRMIDTRENKSYQNIIIKN
jgi:hypothetical protein